MAVEYELVCRQEYSGWGGLAVDLSGYANHGQQFDTQALLNGAKPKSGATRFPLPQSRIRVPASQSLARLDAIRVEAVARIRQLYGDARMIAAADGAFHFFVSSDGVLFGSYNGPVFDSASFGDGLNSGHHSPDGVVHRVPPDSWTELAFSHDGVHTMQLEINGLSVARRTDVAELVPGVGPLGLAIGNAVEGHPFFDGDIDEIRIWRRNPAIVDTAFFSRPLSGPATRCWEDFLQCLGRGLDRNPDCAQLLRLVLTGTLHSAERTLAGKGPKMREEVARIAKDYLALWRSGIISGDAMADVVRRWCDVLRRAGISLRDDARLQALLASECMRDVLAGCTLDCDPEFEAFIRLIIDGCR